MTPNQMRAARSRLEMTQADLATALDLTREAIAQMESGTARIRHVTVLAIWALENGCKLKVNRA